MTAQQRSVLGRQLRQCGKWALKVKRKKKIRNDAQDLLLTQCCDNEPILPRKRRVKALQLIEGEDTKKKPPKLNYNWHSTL